VSTEARAGHRTALCGFKDPIGARAQRGRSARASSRQLLHSSSMQSTGRHAVAIRLLLKTMVPGAGMGARARTTGALRDKQSALADARRLAQVRQPEHAGLLLPVQRGDSSAEACPRAPECDAAAETDATALQERSSRPNKKANKPATWNAPFLEFLNDLDSSAAVQHHHGHR
jgi:hypothetical protein